jgi:Suppressor of fused protein (SUFU)
MSKRFFELCDDAYVPGRWYLTNPTDSQGREVDNPWQFTDGQPVRVEGRLKVPIEHAGRPLGFTLAGLSIPVVHVKAASILTELAPGDVQLLPVDIEGQLDQYLILVATRLIRCIDEQASRIQFWTEEDGLPEKVGQYASVRDLRIDPSKVGDAKVFRPEGWDVALIVSEEIKEALESAGVTGARFEEVTGPSAINPEEDRRWRTFRELWQQADTAREAAWRTLGRLEEESIIPVVVGGSWPSRRQAWRVIHRPGGHLLLVTAGLSDPFYGQTEPSTGFSLELALETSEPLENIEESWPLLLLGRVADEVAEHEGVRERVKAGFMSMEVSGKGMPRSLVTEEGRVGVLLGMGSSTLPRHFPMPAGEVRLVTVKALLPAELAYLLEHGKKGRDELVRRFAESGEEHLSRARRPSAV